MELQTTLTNAGLRILDATCSFGKIWPKHASIRIDIRPECKPDIVMDAKDLKFPDNYFDQIYCDPPHIITKTKDFSKMKFKRRLTGRSSPILMERYGVWKSYEEWLEFMEKTNKEFFRVLKPNGVLFYKITEASGCTKPSDLIERMSNFILIEDKSEPVKSTMGKGKTHWLTFHSRKDIPAPLSGEEQK
jgi:hypothetical protein